MHKDTPLECSGCGWQVPGHDHEVQDALEMLQEHGEKFCARPPYDPPYSA